MKDQDRMNDAIKSMIKIDLDMRREQFSHLINNKMNKSDIMKSEGILHIKI